MDTHWIQLGLLMLALIDLRVMQLVYRNYKRYQASKAIAASKLAEAKRAKLYNASILDRSHN